MHTRRHRLPQGAELLEEGGLGVHFSIWAPGCDRMALELMAGDGQSQAPPLPMESVGAGRYELTVREARAGSTYRFVLPDGMRVPDPASRFQPEDVHGPSEVVDPRAYAWGDAAWRGRPWHESVLYELHVGAFTAAGTFRAAIERLEHLVALGITAIELMPVADFPGRRNWGYDGVLPYAPDASYGRPEDLKALVDAAHARGIMVLLDVVYNHFGPDGNFLPVYAADFFTARHTTPWGAAVNVDGERAQPVREFIIRNAVYWMEEYNFDGLRLDAVHAILDDSAQHLLEELAQRVRAVRPDAHLLLENEANQAQRLLRDTGGHPLQYTAQWNDDVHHVLHVAATGESTGYYADYLGNTQMIGRALAEGFGFQGQFMPYRGAPRGEPSGALPPTAFVAFIQNHDQIGNRACGDRLTTTAAAAAARAVAAVYLLLPQIPMLFMGEEWHAPQPFPFFCDFDGELAEAVREGRRAEFSKFPEFKEAAARALIPDPLAEATFASAKLDWNDPERAEHAAWLAFYRELIAVRHRFIVPLLARIGGNAAQFSVVDKSAVVVRWRLTSPAGVDESAGAGELMLAANLSERQVAGFPQVCGRALWPPDAADRAPLADPWEVRWFLV